jgi:DNA-directed RNA polymerase specialized sigma24 family protein
MKHIYDKHKHWIEIVKGFGEIYYAEDIVQEAYIKVHGKEINEAYFYFTLRSLTMDLHRKKVEVIEIVENYNCLQDEVYTEVDDYIDNYKELMKSWDWYERDLFMLYANSGFSIRKLARETKIPFASVYHTIKKCKQELKKLQNEKSKD